MLRRMRRPVFCTAVVVASALAPVAVRAQSIPPVAESHVPSRAPSLIVSMAASPLALDDWRRSDGPALVGSVQARLNRFFVLEGEATRWTAVDDFGSCKASPRAVHSSPPAASRGVDGRDESPVSRRDIPRDRFCRWRIGRALRPGGFVVHLHLPSCARKPPDLYGRGRSLNPVDGRTQVCRHSSWSEANSG